MIEYDKPSGVLILSGGYDPLNRETCLIPDRARPCPYVFIDFVFPTDRRRRRNRID